MKKILLIAVLMLCLVPLFAVQSFYKQLPAMFLVDLRAEFYKSHTQNATWSRGSATATSSNSNYYDNQIIAVLGVTGASEDVTFSLSLSSGSWLYLLDSSDSTIARPFGLDLIIKGRTPAGGNTETYITNENGSHVIHMGLQEASGGTILDPSQQTTTFTIPASTLSSYGNTVWFDMCLVLPPINADGTVTIGDTTYTAKNSSSVYTTRLSINVQSGTLNETYSLDLTGTYQRTFTGTTDTGLKSMMTVIPTAVATSLNLQGLGSTAANVATYSYMTESKYVGYIDYKNANAYIFLSSEPSQTTTGQKFKLRRVRDNGTYSNTDNEYNSVTFVAMLVSEDGNTKKEFDGTTTYSTTNTNNYFEIKGKTTTSQNGENFVRWYSNGTIQIKLTPEGNENTALLVAGKYTETIYIHVVSPE